MTNLFLTGGTAAQAPLILNPAAEAHWLFFRQAAEKSWKTNAIALGNRPVRWPVRKSSHGWHRVPGFD